jgi:hypothetical protein
VVGNKSDTVAGDSLIARAKQIKAKTDNLTATPTDETSLAVPTADVSTNVKERDVIGNKSDAAVTTIGIVASILGYIKGALTRLNQLVAGDQTVNQTTYAMANNTSEQDAIVFTVASGQVFKVGRIGLDLTNWANDANITANDTLTIRKYRKIDGTNYRKVSFDTWRQGNIIAGTIPHPEIIIDLIIEDWKITVQSSTATAAAPTIPYAFSSQRVK